MGYEELSRAVRGSGGAAISTNANGTVETDNYAEGQGFSLEPSLTGEAYPLSIDPAFTIEELLLTEVGDIQINITTITGSTFSFMPKSTKISMDTVEMESVEFTDPNGTGAPLFGALVGE